MVSRRRERFVRGSASRAARPRAAVILAALALILAALAAAGCGSSNEGSSAGATQAAAAPSGGDGATTASGGGDLQTVTVGGIAIPHFAPILLGEQQGFFADEGIRLDVKYAEGGAALVPAVVSGEYDVGYGNIISTILAAAKGLPLTVVAPADIGEAEPGPGASGGILLVRRDSPIRTMRDLEGKTIASNTLQNTQTILTRAAGDRLGADSSSYRFVELGFPDMLAALDARRVDAVATVEPFYTQARESGDYRFIEAVYPAVAPRLFVDTYFSSERWVQENPDLSQAFQRAVVRSQQYANAHLDEVRALVPSFTQIPAAVATRINLPSWAEGPIPPDGLDVFGEIMQRYGLIDDAGAAGDLLSR